MNVDFRSADRRGNRKVMSTLDQLDRGSPERAAMAEVGRRLVCAEGVGGHSHSQRGT